jgi:hypothetical protein
MDIVQDAINKLNHDCKSIQQLNITGLYADATMILSPVAEGFNSTGKELLAKTKEVVFVPGKLKTNIEAWECGKIDKFLADNPHLRVCFAGQTFDLSSGGAEKERNAWDVRYAPDPKDNGFKLDHKDRVTVLAPKFVNVFEGKSIDIDQGLNPTLQLKEFAHVVR